MTVYSSVVYAFYTASLKVAGITYLAQNSLLIYILNPFTWLFFVVSILLSLFLIMLEISALYKLYDASRQGMKIGVYSILHQGIEVAWRSLQPKNWLLLLYLLLMLPILGISMVSTMSYSIIIPGAVMTAIEKMKVIYVLFCVLMVLLFLYTCRLQYSVCKYFSRFRKENFYGKPRTSEKES